MNVNRRSQLFMPQWHKNAYIVGVHTGFLLGDSGYPCRRFLLCPFLVPTCRAQKRYNRSLCRTRVLIEQTFGILKRRFSCLENGLKTNPKQAVIYTLASVVLHNLGIERGDILDDDEDEIDPEAAIDPDDDTPNLPDGTAMRQHIVHTYFSRWVLSTSCAWTWESDIQVSKSMFIINKFALSPGHDMHKLNESIILTNAFIHLTDSIIMNIAVCKTQMPPFPNMWRVGLTFYLDLWPTDLSANRDHVRMKDYLPTKFEASGAKRSRVIRYTRFERLKWPLTLTFDLLTWLSIGIIYSSRTIYLPSLKLLGQSILE